MAIKIPVAIYHEMMVKGRATMYRILLVKFTIRLKFPKNPHTNDIALRVISLISNVKHRLMRV